VDPLGLDGPGALLRGHRRGSPPRTIRTFVITITFRAKLLAIGITIAIAAAPYPGRTAAASPRGFVCAPPSAARVTARRATSNSSCFS